MMRVVALLAEGVDRNIEVPRSCCVTVVALLAEGVDRNLVKARVLEDDNRSPSSRRAWIEISSSPVVSPFWISRPPRGGRG